MQPCSRWGRPHAEAGAPARASRAWLTWPTLHRSHARTARPPATQPPPPPLSNSQNRSHSLALTQLYYDWPKQRNLNIITSQLGVRGTVWDLEFGNGTSFIFSREEPLCKVGRGSCPPRPKSACNQRPRPWPPISRRWLARHCRAEQGFGQERGGGGG